ncbi:MAG: amidohydrolase [Paracoccaceae bacterium]
MFLNTTDVQELTAWRRDLHRFPELSGQEEKTAQKVAEMGRALGADRVLCGLGGHGVAMVFEGALPGPKVMIRAELDALPITEISNAPHRSEIQGTAHLCGHDGHSTILAALARGLSRKRPNRGQVILLFQPAEETGAGAKAVINDPQIAEITPDFAFALHNMPGLPLGEASLIEGGAACASRGMRIVLSGKTAHASMPETGRSPMRAMASIMQGIAALGQGAPLGAARPKPGFCMATITHAAMGAPAFGIAPGSAEILATLRSLSDADMADLIARAQAICQDAAKSDGLTVQITYEEVFAASENHPAATKALQTALTACNIPACNPEDPHAQPMRASEDFGRFNRLAPSAMLLLGAGIDHPALHNPDYDFPDELIPIGANIFMALIRQLTD